MGPKKKYEKILFYINKNIVTYNNIKNMRRIFSSYMKNIMKIF
jgi:hypothetical protein